MSSRRVRYHMFTMHEQFDHTADLGLRIVASSLPVLFEEAGEALFCTILEDLVPIRPTESVRFRVAGTARDDLLYDYLSELLRRFEVDEYVFRQFRVEFDADGISVEAWGEPLDAERHLLNHEVKAITYHGLRVELTEDGWLAEVIVDI